MPLGHISNTGLGGLGAPRLKARRICCVQRSGGPGTRVGGGGGHCSGTRAAGGRLRFTWARARTRPAWGRGSDARRRPPGRRRGKGRGEERACGGRALGRGSGAPLPVGRSSAAGKRERPVAVGAGESRARGRAGESAAAGRSSTSGGEAPKLQTEFGVFLSFHSHLTEI